MNELYRYIGISKQAVYQYDSRQEVFDKKMSKLVIEVDALRRAHPGCGVEKMYYILKPDFIGRDRFVEAFMSLGYRLKRQKNFKRTTYSTLHYYPNLIKGKQINKPSCVWQSDITYIKVGEVYYYAVFIIDVYTRKIVGYQVSDHMRATANVKALRMALKEHSPPEIHHSDRGSQYIYHGYIDLLKSKGTRISMGLTAQDNAYVERFHRTIKEEYLKYWDPLNLDQLKKYVRKAVKNYNRTRVHCSLDKCSPKAFTEQTNKMSPNQRPMTIIYNENLIQ